MSELHVVDWGTYILLCIFVIITQAYEINSNSLYISTLCFFFKCVVWTCGKITMVLC